jgi:hypothetical protein
MTGRPAGAAGIRTNRSPATTKLAGPPPSPCSRTTQNARANTKVISITTQRRSSHTHTPITGRWSFRSRWAGAEPAGIMHSTTPWPRHLQVRLQPTAGGPTHEHRRKRLKRHRLPPPSGTGTRPALEASGTGPEAWRPGRPDSTRWRPAPKFPTLARHWYSDTDVTVMLVRVTLVMRPAGRNVCQSVPKQPLVAPHEQEGGGYPPPSSMARSRLAN